MQVNDQIESLQKSSHYLDMVNMEYSRLEEQVNEKAAALKSEDAEIQRWEGKMNTLSQRRRLLTQEVAASDSAITEEALTEWLGYGGAKKMYGGVVQIRQTQSPIHTEEQVAIGTILQAVLAEALPAEEAAAMLKIVRSAVVKAHKRDCIVAREILKYKDTTKAAIIPSGLVNWKK